MAAPRQEIANVDYSDRMIIAYDLMFAVIDNRNILL